MKRYILILFTVLLGQNIQAQLVTLYYAEKFFELQNEKILKSDCKKADNGNVHLQISCALRYWGKKDYDKCREYLNKAIKANNDTAMVFIAEMDYYGYGIKKTNFDNAYQTAIKAYRRGNLYANFILGKIYYDKGDFNKAFSCFMAVPHSYPNIRLNYYYISKCYRYGRGVSKSIEKSKEFLNKAYIKKSPEYSFNCGWCRTYYMRHEEFDENKIEKIAVLLSLKPDSTFIDYKFSINVDSKSSIIKKQGTIKDSLVKTRKNTKYH